jgi:septal ring factor EnvC (AmiA/AmiB activator)
MMKKLLTFGLVVAFALPMAGCNKEALEKLEAENQALGTKLTAAEKKTGELSKSLTDIQKKLGDVTAEADRLKAEAEVAKLQASLKSQGVETGDDKKEE